MKTILIAFLFLLMPKLCISQLSANDKMVYFDSIWKVSTQDNYKYYRITKDYYLDQKEYKVFDYYKNNILKKEFTVKGKDGGVLNGAEINYYENGEKQNILTYVNGRPTGITLSWYENGNLMKEGEYTGNYEIEGKQFKINQYWDENNIQQIVDGNGLYFSGKTTDFQETGMYKDGYRDGNFECKSPKENTSYLEKYENGKFISGTVFFADGTTTDYLEMQTKPVPKNGIKDLYSFIGKKYRVNNLPRGVEGKIFVKFIVDKDGQIVEPIIIRDIGFGTGEEAIRVLLKYGNWEPGQQRGRKIRCLFTLPISIKSPN